MCQLHLTMSLVTQMTTFYSVFTLEDRTCPFSLHSVNTGKHKDSCVEYKRKAPWEAINVGDGHSCSSRNSFSNQESVTNYILGAISQK